MTNAQKSAKMRKGVRMKLTKRQREILDILKEQGYAKVEYLSKKTYISPSSVRRDLHYMENLGIVERDYGGVRMAGQERKNPPIQVRKSKDRTAKRELAARAASLVQSGYSVLLDSSTTTFYMVEPLSKIKNVTIFTNNLETAMACIEQGLPVYVIGGRALRGMPVLSGAYAEEMLEKISVDIAFLSSYGINSEGTVTDTSEEENKMRKIMMAHSQKNVLLLDKTKVGRSAPHILCSVEQIDHLVTNDYDLSERYAKAKALKD
jgi:DeoR/GlpR family transcriptional regulator of sugar metabolism